MGLYALDQQPIVFAKSFNIDLRIFFEQRSDIDPRITFHRQLNFFLVLEKNKYIYIFIIIMCSIDIA